MSLSNKRATYILAGGNDRASNAYGKKLAAEITARIDSPVRIVSCFYASPKPQWSQKAIDWGRWFANMLGTDLEYRYAIENDLAEKIAYADIVYLHGGDNDLMIRSLKRYEDLKALFAGKIVIGSSAGANALSVSFWTRSKWENRTGLGILPIHVMTHYGSSDGGYPDPQVIDWQEADKLMNTRAGTSGKVLRIREGTFKVLEK